MSDNINPRHYTHFRQEVVDTLEDWVSRAPDPISGAHQFNAGRYLSRIWDKPAEGGPVEHIEKAIWYLERLKDHVQKDHVPSTDPADPTPDYEEILKDFAHETLTNEAGMGWSFGLNGFTLGEA